MKHSFVISKRNWKQIINYAQSAYDEFKSEIGGMSIMVRNGDIWELKKPVILKQEVTASECDLDKEALAAWYSKTAVENQNIEYRICWWHSHNTMRAFWSPTDKKAIEEYNNSDISFALVVNLREEYKFRVSMWTPLEHCEDVPLVIYDLNRKINQKMTNEVKALCSEPEISTYNGYGARQTTMFKKNTASNVVAYTEADEYETDINYAPIQAAFDFAKSIREDYSDGSINKLQYKKEVNFFNDMLKEKGITYSIKILTKSKAEELEYSNDFTDFIDSEDGSTPSLDEYYGGWV
jgi:hypothetical protein